MKARARLVTPGYADLDNLKGKLRKDAPTLPREAMSMLLQSSSVEGLEDPAGRRRFSLPLGRLLRARDLRRRA